MLHRPPAGPGICGSRRRLAATSAHTTVIRPKLRGHVVRARFHELNGVPRLRCLRSVPCRSGDVCLQHQKETRRDPRDGIPWGRAPIFGGHVLL